MINQDCRKNVHNLRYADGTTLMAKSEEKLKSLLMNAKDESEKSGLKLNIQKAKIMEPSPITSWQVVVQLHSCVRLFATSWTATHLAFLSLTIS